MKRSGNTAFPKEGMKVLKNKVIYTGDGKIESGYIRYDTKIVERVI